MSKCKGLSGAVLDCVGMPCDAASVALRCCVQILGAGAVTTESAPTSRYSSNINDKSSIGDAIEGFLEVIM